MRIFLIVYWLIGCMSTGFVLAKSTQWCPDDKVDARDMLIITVLWPTAPIAVLAGAYSKRVCADGTPYRVATR